MQRLGSLIAVATTLGFGTMALALEPMPETKVSMESCLSSALARQPGEVKELELSVENGVPHYEFEIVGADGIEVEVECDAMTGKIVEVERENANMDLDAFLRKARVAPAEARQIALRKVQGRVVKMDLETNTVGVMSYEFEIRTSDGGDVDVEVDANSGKIIEVEYDVYEIGDIDD